MFGKVQITSRLPKQVCRSLYGILCAIMLASCGLEANRNKSILSFFDDDDQPISTGGDQEFDPSAGEGGNTNPIEDEAACVPSGDIVITPASTIEFGLSQMGHEECHEIKITPCYTFAAEIDSSSSASEQAGADNGSETIHEFFLRKGTTDITGRQSNLTDSVLVCYRRQSVGVHQGRINIVVNGSASVIPLKGTSVEGIIGVNSPQDGQLIWEKNTSLQDAAADRPYFNYFPLTVSGTITLGYKDPANENVDLITSNEVIIAVDSGNGGITQKTVFDDTGRFSWNIEIPPFPVVYAIKITIQTTHGALTRTINVIRHYAPDTTLTIKDVSGKTVSSMEATETPEVTNAPLLNAGLEFKNIAVAGPSLNSPVRLKFYITKESGEKIYYEGGETWSSQANKSNEFTYYNGYSDEGFTDGECPAGFENKKATFCLPLPGTAQLSRGINRLTAVTCNEYTEHFGGICRLRHGTIIVDNGRPRITIDTPISPPTKTHYGPNEPIILSGTVENFAATTTDKDKNENSVLARVEGKCKYSSVVFWLNTSTEKPAEPICPEVAFEDLNFDNAFTGNASNFRKAAFRIDLNQSPFKEKLIHYTNLIRIEAVNASGHKAIQVVSFQRGEFRPSPANTSNQPSMASLITAALGDTVSNGKTRRTPIQLGINESTLKSEEVIAVLENFLTEEVNLFHAFVQGGDLPGDDNGNNLEDTGETIDFESRLNIPDGQDFFSFNDPDDIQKKTWIWQNLHGTMPQKARALANYRVYQVLRGNGAPGNAENIFFEGQCSENDPKSFESGWNVACDSCGNRISTALVPYDTFPYVFRDFYHETSSIFDRRDWPKACGNSLTCNNDLIHGKWKVGNLELKDNGFIDADICIVGEGDLVDGCDDVADDNPHKPALWGHMSAISLIEGGITTLENDPLLPLVWNVGKLRISLKDALQIKKVTLPDGSFSNKLIIHKNKLIDGINGSIKLEPYLQCANFYKSRYGQQWPIPFGCTTDGEVHPVLVDRTALAGETAWADLGGAVNNYWLLDVLYVELLKTFKNMLSCLANEVVNPLLNADDFPYPPWVHEKDRIELEFAVVDNTVKDEISIKQLKDLESGEKAVFTFTPDIKRSDLLIDDEKLRAKLLLTIGATDIDTTVVDTQKAGHLFRSTTTPNFESIYPIHNPGAVGPQLGLSLGIEETANSAFSILIKKGLRNLLDLFDVDELDPPNGYETNQWTIGLDKVIFGRFDICDSVGGLLNTTLPISLLFNKIGHLFDTDATHWDIELDPDQTPTLLLDPKVMPTPILENGLITGLKNEATVKIGLSNVKIKVSNFAESRERVGFFSIGEPVVTLRVDAVLSLRLAYDVSTRKLEIFVLPLDEQALYLSVAESGGSYNDQDVIEDAYTVMAKNAFSLLSRGGRPSYTITLPEKLTDFNESCFVKLPIGEDGLSPIPSKNHCDDDDNNDGISSDSFVGLTIIDHTGLGENGACEGQQKAVYDSNLIITPEMLAAASRPVTLRPLMPNLNQIRWALEHNLADEDPDTDVEACDFDESIKDDGTNDLRKALCDLGIEEVRFGTNDPRLELDIYNGYIHLSLEPVIDIYEGLFDAVSTDLVPQGE